MTAYKFLDSINSPNLGINLNMIKNAVNESRFLINRIKYLTIGVIALLSRERQPEMYFERIGPGGRPATGGAGAPGSGGGFNRCVPSICAAAVANASQSRK